MIVPGFNSSEQFSLPGATLPPGATFVADVKRAGGRAGVGDVLTRLSTALGTVTLTFDAGTPIITLIFLAADTAEWDFESVVTDVVRTDVSPSQYLGFKAIIPVDLPVTVVTP